MKGIFASSTFAAFTFGAASFGGQDVFTTMLGYFSASDGPVSCGDVIVQAEYDAAEEMVFQWLTQ